MSEQGTLITITEAELEARVQAAVEEFVSMNRKTRSTWMKARARLLEKANKQPHVFDLPGKAVELICLLCKQMLRDKYTVAKLTDESSQILDSLMDDIWELAAKYRNEIRAVTNDAFKKAA